MGIYQSLPAEDRDLKLDAFNGAESIFSALPEGTDKGAMANSVRPLMKSSDPDDRWYAITTLLKLEGEKVLDTAWDSLMDDGIYTNGLIDPLKSIVDFCREGIEPLGKNSVDKTLKMVK